MSTNKTIKKHGFWPSELTAQKVAGKALRFGGLETSDGVVYWTESRPDEGGRSVIVKRLNNGQIQDVIDAPFSASSRVHEYGGGEFGLGSNCLVFVNAKDQDLYKVDLSTNSKPVRLTQIKNMRFADIQIFDNEVIAVAELHKAGEDMPQNMLISLSLSANKADKVKIITSGQDFYAYPRVSPCKTKLAYMTWNLPNMPWQNAQIITADITPKGLQNSQVITGGGSSAGFAPTWGRDGLYYISDETGIGNLYVYKAGKAVNMLPINAECGHPNWVFAMRSFDVFPNGDVAVRIIEAGIFKLIIINADNKTTHQVDLGFRNIDKITALDNEIACFISLDDKADTLVTFSTNPTNFNIIAQSSAITLNKADISVGQIFKYNVGNNSFAYGIYYPPANAKYTAKQGELPPIIVKAHGGPTGFAGRGFNTKFHYWTNRGFAIVDLDYRGSFGYGRDYVQQLDGNWGITDVEDAVAAVKHLADNGKVNANQAFITGGSAGGFTVLMALATTNKFLAGTSYYGVADLGGLAKSTHKFELKYMDELVGLPQGLSADEVDAFFLSRSALSKLDNYNSPTLFLQGLDDKVVPPEQSQIMYDALKAKNITTKLLTFKGEGHGFKQAKVNIKCLEEELNFYQELL